MYERIEEIWSRIWSNWRRDVARALSRGDDRWRRPLADELSRHLSAYIFQRVDVVVSCDDELRRDGEIRVSVVVRGGGVSWGWSETYPNLGYLAREGSGRFDDVRPLRPPDDRADAMAYARHQFVVADLMRDGSDGAATLTDLHQSSRTRDAVDRLVKACRTIADAVALQLAASLSLLGSAYAATTTPSATVKVTTLYVRHVCVEHGLTTSFLDATGTVASSVTPGTRSCQVCWMRSDARRRAVATLVQVVRACVDAVADQLRRAVGLLVEICHQVGHVLWESLDGWQRRVCLLETERTPHALVSGVDRDERFELLELS